VPAVERPPGVREVASGQLPGRVGPFQALVDERVELDRVGEVHAIAGEPSNRHGSLVRLRSLRSTRPREILSRRLTHAPLAAVTRTASASCVMRP
jgi:hypothetical protein